jgi:hypothetical protein
LEEEVWRLRRIRITAVTTVGRRKSAIKKLVADLSLDKQMLQDVLKKKL